MPFSAWLPAAMAAPTPISALVHSSTLVTAGVVLSLKTPAIVFSNGVVSTLSLILGGLTFFLSAIRAYEEGDIKKIVALSTLRQLGFIVLTIGLLLPCLTLFHIMVHAFFKALLFLSVGKIIEGNTGSQEASLSSSERRVCPLNSSVFIVSLLSIRGFVFLSGFISKDLILEGALSSNRGVTQTLFIVLIRVVRVGYSLRLVKSSVLV